MTQGMICFVSHISASKEALTRSIPRVWYKYIINLMLSSMVAFLFYFQREFNLTSQGILLLCHNKVWLVMDFPFFFLSWIMTKLLHREVALYNMSQNASGKWQLSLKGWAQPKPRFLESQALNYLTSHHSRSPAGLRAQGKSVCNMKENKQQEGNNNNKKNQSINST